MESDPLVPRCQCPRLAEARRSEAGAQPIDPQPHRDCFMKGLQLRSSASANVRKPVGCGIFRRHRMMRRRHAECGKPAPQNCSPPSSGPTTALA